MNLPIKPIKTFLFAILPAAVSFAFTISSRAEEGGELNRYAATDAVVATISKNISGLKPIVVIDHSRLAAKEGVMMPPCVVTIYSDPAVDSALMKRNPRIGLDLPQKILVFEADGEPRVAFPHASFLAARNAVTDEAALNRYQESINTGLRGVAAEVIDPVTDRGVTRNYGMIELVSDFEHDDTITRLKKAVMKQGDTVWFGDIDFHANAAKKGVDLPRSTLLLFGGPKPGGVAMAKFPKLGLDAFCQKLLVFEDSNGKVRVIFNDIVKMAELHYGKSADPHKAINGRLATTFEGAVRKTDK